MFKVDCWFGFDLNGSYFLHTRDDLGQNLGLNAENIEFLVLSSKGYVGLNNNVADDLRRVFGVLDNLANLLSTLTEGVDETADDDVVSIVHDEKLVEGPAFGAVAREVDFRNHDEVLVGGGVGEVRLLGS